jgi:hypothetical protein
MSTKDEILYSVLRHAYFQFIFNGYELNLHTTHNVTASVFYERTYIITLKINISGVGLADILHK